MNIYPNIYKAKITAYSDGASRGNPGKASCAYVIYKDGEEIDTGARELGIQTNNYAEYQGLIEALFALKTWNYTKAEIFCDSTLVVNQVNNVWRVKDQKLKEHHALAQGLLINGSHILSHVDGHKGIKGNERADQLCNNILDAVELGNGYWKNGNDRS